MAQSVSNDALWEKLSELDQKLEQLSEMQKSSNLSNEQAVVKPYFQKDKDEIVAEIKQQASLLGKHGDINFGVVNQNIGTANENISKVFNIVTRIRKQQKEATQQRSEVFEISTNDNREYFNFRFFKVKKTFLIIAVLGLFVFILTVFCMKQQNDYALLLNEYYRQNIVIKEIQTEVDTLRTAIQKPKDVKKSR